MYHGIDRVENQRFNQRHFSAKSFENHLRFFKNTFEIVPLRQVMEDTDEATRRRFRIAITFDDGYRNVFKYAIPLLEKYDAPATLFVTGLNQTDECMLWADLYDISRALTNEDVEFAGRRFSKRAIDGGYYCLDGASLPEAFKSDSRPGLAAFKELKNETFRDVPDFTKDAQYDDYWVLMSDEEIRASAAVKGIEIGSHGYYHNNLGRILLDDAYDELQRSKAYLEQLTQKEVDAVAYPDGSYVPATIEFASVLGFRYQCACHYSFPRDRSDSRITNRFGLYPKERYRTMAMIAKEIRGHGRG
jgi:peptidoglycan/xylan/chitin deacetylase (PgdA/CDA1 family)